jgi:hypothetical protein
MKNTKKTIHYLIECTLDPTYKNWEIWDKQVYLSYSVIKDVVWKLAQSEAEYNRTAVAQDPKIRKVLGFRIIQNVVETTTEIITEFLLDPQ